MQNESAILKKLTIYTTHPVCLKEENMSRDRSSFGVTLVPKVWFTWWQTTIWKTNFLYDDHCISSLFNLEISFQNRSFESWLNKLVGNIICALKRFHFFLCLNVLSRCSMIFMKYNAKWLLFSFLSKKKTILVEKYANTITINLIMDLLINLGRFKVSQNWISCSWGRNCTMSVK